ncbi:MAG: ABC transporter permease [Dehalococcoidales bacterium]
MTVFGKLLVANFRQFSRERSALFFTFAFPIIFILVFGLVFSGGTESMSYTIGLVVADEDSESGAMIAEALSQVPIFETVEGDLESSLEALRNGDVSAVVAVPAGIDAGLATGQPAEITFYYDPTRTTSAQVLQPTIREIIHAIDRRISRQPPLLVLSEKTIQSQDEDSDDFWADGGRVIDFMVPGILAMSVLFLGLQGVMPLVELREKKTLKRLGATPLNRGMIIYSQVAYRLVLSVIQALLIIAIARFVFGVQMVGNWWLLLGILLLGTSTLISIGFLITARARTVEGATPMVMGIQFPMMFLSGIFFPTNMMPDFMKPIMAALPLTYLGDAFRQVMVDATPLYPLGVDVAVLGGWLVVCIILSVRLFRWE